MTGMDGLTALQRKVAARPPLVPALPPMHPRVLPAPSPASGPSEEAPAVDVAAVAAEVAQPIPPPAAPWAGRPRGSQPKGNGQTAGQPYTTMGLLTLRPDQVAWVRQLRIEALQAGADLAVTDLVRVALDRLRAQDGRWSALRDALAAETEQRTRRR